MSAPYVPESAAELAGYLASVVATAAKTHPDDKGLARGVAVHAAWKAAQEPAQEPTEDAVCDYGYPLGGMHPRADWCKLPAGHEGLHKGDWHPIGFTNTGTIRRGGTR